MVSMIGVILMVIGGINLAWFCIWILIAWSGSAGAKISKKVGLDNERTDENIEIAQNLGKEAFVKLSISAVLLGVGAIMYYLIGS